MTRLLDTSKEGDVSGAILETLDELGYPPEEAIPGLIQAVFRLADSGPNPEAYLDEAANLLADGGS